DQPADRGPANLAALLRTCSASNPSNPPRYALSWWGVWDEIHIVRRPSSPNWAAEERGSIGRAAIRWLIKRPLTRTSLDSSRFGSAPSAGRWKQMFVPTS